MWNNNRKCLFWTLKPVNRFWYKPKTKILIWKWAECGHRGRPELFPQSWKKTTDLMFFVLSKPGKTGWDLKCVKMLKYFEPCCDHLGGWSPLWAPSSTCTPPHCSDTWRETDTPITSSSLHAATSQLLHKPLSEATLSRLLTQKATLCELLSVWNRQTAGPQQRFCLNLRNPMTILWEIDLISHVRTWKEFSLWKTGWSGFLTSLGLLISTCNLT